MRMDPHDVAALRETLPVFTDRPDEVAEYFYARLFETGPDPHDLFPDDLSDLGVKLSRTLSLAITATEDWTRWPRPCPPPEGPSAISAATDSSAADPGE